MIKYGNITETITRSIAVMYKCDCCGKETTEEMEYAVMSHEGWGVDSEDSYSNKEYCSNKCYVELAKKFLVDPRYARYKGANFDGMLSEKLRVLIDYKGN